MRLVGVVVGPPSFDDPPGRGKPASRAWRPLSGVNITLGLPLIRSSVDHGAAFDIAGQCVAGVGNQIKAIDIAIGLAAAR